MKSIKRILFALCITYPIICIISFGLSYFTNTQVTFEVLFWYWVVIFLTSLILFFRDKIRFWIILFTGLILISLLIHSMFTSEIYIRSEAENSPYQIEVESRGYRIIQQYYFFKRVIAKKQSTSFASNNTKIGIVHFPKIKLLSENSNELVVEIHPSTKIDTLQKLGGWRK